MKDFTIGSIKETSNNGKIEYSLNFYDKFVSKRFEKKEKLLDFVSKEAKALFGLKENTMAAIEYINFDKIRHYIVVKEVNDQIAVAEQSEYEYREAQALLFPEAINRRKINDRHYDFSDIVRASANFRTILVWIKLTIFSILSMMSIVLLIDIVNIYSGSARISVPGNEAWYVMFAAIECFLAFCSLFINIFATHYTIMIHANDFSQHSPIDFRAVTRKRQNFRLFNLCFQSASAVVIFTIFIMAVQDNIFASFNGWSILISINLSLTLFVYLFQLAYITFIYANLYLNFKKYFPNYEYKVFWKWYKKGKSEEHIGSRNIFLLSNEDSRNVYDMEITNLQYLKGRYTKSELRSFLSKTKSQLNKAVQKRVEEIKKGA